MTVTVEINNAPAELEKYLVVRGIDPWFYGSYESRKKAEEVATIIGGMVLERR